jgi:hypothetical protein
MDSNEKAALVRRLWRRAKFTGDDEVAAMVAAISYMGRLSTRHTTWEDEAHRQAAAQNDSGGLVFAVRAAGRLFPDFSPSGIGAVAAAFHTAKLSYGVRSAKLGPFLRSEVYRNHLTGFAGEPRDFARHACDGLRAAK